MKRICLFMLALMLLNACSKDQHVSSPDGRLSVGFRLTESGCPQYCVQQDGGAVIDWSELGLRCVEADLSSGFKYQGSKQKKHQSVGRRYGVKKG